MKSYTFKVLLFGLALFGLGTASYHRPGLQAPTVMNKTKSVEIISLVPTDRGNDLLLRNITPKNITGYSVAFKNGASTTVDLTVGERVIAPGDQFTVHLPESLEMLQPSIRYVVFDDDTGDGDATAILELQDRRAGRREQLRRIVSMLNTATASANLEQLKTDLQSLPEGTAAGRSVYFTLGLRNAKEDALLEVGKLDKSNVRAELTKLAEKNNKRMIRLQARQSNP
jgi:hypothetical protein